MRARSYSLHMYMLYESICSSLVCVFLYTTHYTQYERKYNAFSERILYLVDSERYHTIKIFPHRLREVNYISSHSTRDKIIIIKRFIRGYTIYINISNRSVAEITTCATSYI